MDTHSRKPYEKKRWLTLLAVILLFASPTMAQDRGEVGAFAEIFRLGTITPATNFAGIGIRASKHVHQNVQFEAELSYDFQRDFVTPFSNGPSIANVPSRMSVLNFLFGPKIQSTGPISAFVTLKVGVLDFNVSRASVPPGFTTAVNRAINGGTAGAFYPGGGVELFKGRIGLRAEVGDEIYFDNGGNNNLRATIGPQFRF
ncbi:MAG TPA: hypothetical protein VFU27_07375 [Terriglobales bacterium]|nr:hypothetical protein [Terriglobales bacterium]